MRDRFKRFLGGSTDRIWGLPRWRGWGLGTVKEKEV